MKIRERLESMPVSRTIVYAIVLSLVLTAIVELAAAQRYRAQVQVTDVPGVGVNPTTEILDFGDMCGGSEQTRFVKLDNEGESDAFIIVWTLGGIGELIDVGRDSFVLDGGESTQVSFRLQVPPSAPVKTYSGTVFILRLPYFG